MFNELQEIMMSRSRQTNNRYSEAFKMQVISDLESGKFGSVTEARRHYGIAGTTTVNGWLRAPPLVNAPRGS